MLLHTNLSGALMTDIDLGGGDLTGANLSGANLSGVDLTGIYMSGADFTGANLRGASIYLDDLQGKTGVDLTPADLTDVNII